VLKAEEGNKAAAARLRKQLKNVKFLIKKIVDQSREIKTKGSV
jgi:hypothetical protein